MREPSEYAFISPDGQIYKGKNIRRFAVEHGLDQANMQHVHCGDRVHHKGWRALEEWSLGEGNDK